jgi:hypothetical protein
LPPQDAEDLDKYVLMTADGPEISIQNRTARFKFRVSRDEPYNEDNKVWINWGVFDGPNDQDLTKVHGSSSAYDYEMALTYDDYFDRVFINGIYWAIGITGIFTFWAALPLQLVPMTVLAIYVAWQPIMIWFFAPVSKNFTFENFFTSVVWRWQTGTYAALISMILTDLITYTPFIYLGYQANAQSGNVTNTDWEYFAGYSIFAWIIQAFVTLIAAAIPITFLYY